MMLMIGVETSERQRQETYGAEREKKNAEEIDGMIKKKEEKNLGRWREGAKKKVLEK